MCVFVYCTGYLGFINRNRNRNRTVSVSASASASKGPICVLPCGQAKSQGSRWRDPRSPPRHLCGDRSQNHHEIPPRVLEEREEEEEEEEREERERRESEGE